MPVTIEPLPENERHRRDIEEQVARYLGAGGKIQSFGVTPAEGLRTRREMNDQVGRTVRGPKTNV
jgi:hypothetical protein